MKRNHIILIVIVAVILVVFPTPHTHTRQEPYENLIVTLDCWQTLNDGYQIADTWDIPFIINAINKIVINVQSNEEINIKIKTTTSTLYDSTLKTHNSIIFPSGSYYEVTVTNPSIFGTGSPATMSGNIKGYNTGTMTTTTTSWLPWWMP